MNGKHIPPYLAESLMLLFQIHFSAMESVSWDSKGLGGDHDADQ